MENITIQKKNDVQNKIQNEKLSEKKHRNVFVHCSIFNSRFSLISLFFHQSPFYKEKVLKMRFRETIVAGN